VENKKQVCSPSESINGKKENIVRQWCLLPRTSRFGKIADRLGKEIVRKLFCDSLEASSDKAQGFFFSRV
jgi:hypothetical protein